MHTGVLEWCHDWYGTYPDSDQVDPVGPAAGIARVIRGGGIQQRTVSELQRRAEPVLRPRRKPRRAHPELSARGAGWLPGRRGADARNRAAPGRGASFRRAVRETEHGPCPGRAPARPPLLQAARDPSDSSGERLRRGERAVGLPDGILWHNHSPGLEVLPNGDVFAMYFTSAGYVDQRRDPACVSGEATPDIALLAVRLRYGSDEWEMPDLLLDYPDINDVAPLLWHDRGVVRLFWGGYLSGVPFQTAVSRDNGATWIDLRFIRPTGSFGPFGVGQPINTAFRGSDERIYVACDGADKDSVLWASSDNGRTWQDTGGRTGGRHSTCVKLREDRSCAWEGKAPASTAICRNRSPGTAGRVGM